MAADSQDFSREASKPKSAVHQPNASAQRGESVTSFPATAWLRQADQLLLGSLLIVLLVLLIACRGKMSGWGQAEIEILSQQPREYYYAIDINRASWVEWAQLDGIGEVMARRIVDERQRHGPFQSIEDLRRVRGVGTNLIEKLRPFLTITDFDHHRRGI